ncbi:MAG TPA: NAD(P)-dependent alcohol dehydrogenase [Bryobacteraceae bacterium]|nr:NAD(P)-dependent alcohol dehydrogenase [Bryobacteraceae bacterium]
MKAAVHSAGVIQIRSVATPILKDDEVLVRVHAATVCAADYRIARILRSIPGRAVLGLRRKPVIMGMELAGTVDSVGKAVVRFRAGDQVFGGTGFRFGTHAEYACAPESRLELKPSNMTLRESAAVMFGGLTAFAFLRKANIQAGQNVLVYGASGSVGVFAVQLAKHFGARVTGVCSTANLDLVKSLGAHAVVDYTRDDFSSAGRVYDLVIDTVGKAGFSRTLRSLKRGGPWVRVAPSGGIKWSSLLLSIVGDTLLEIWVSMTGAAKIIGGLPPIAPADLSVLRGLIEAGELRTVIDRCYSLDEVAGAFRYAEAGHKKGHVVLVLAQPDSVS